MHANQAAASPALTLEAHQDYSYVPRTGENARGADVTVAFAVDFSTAGERLTKREAGTRYIGITYGIDTTQAAAQLVKFMRAREGTSLNVAGNGVYSLVGRGITQVQANQWVYEVLKLVHSKVRLTLVRSGGQTGIDQAGLVAAIAIGVPALGFFPKSFRRRNALGIDASSTKSAIQEELMAQAAALTQGTGRRFHVDGTLPTNGEIFVFGSNLAGRHGKGSAEVAKLKFGAIYGQGEGRQGQSYGIPTKDGRPGTPALSNPAATLSLAAIQAHVEKFLAYAKSRPNEQFFVVKLGTVLANHEDKDIAPMFSAATPNCSFSEAWKPWLDTNQCKAPEVVKLAEAINIWSGTRGLGGALTNMSELAKRKGCIKYSYPVKVNGMHYEDSEAAYQALKVPGEDLYNDGLMIDIIALKLVQNQKLLDLVTQFGGVDWLATCSHFTHAKSESFQAWEGQGYGSRFIRNLIHGYQKAITGLGPVTRVVHVNHAPYDVYIGRKMGDKHPQSVWHNPVRIEGDCTREDAVQGFYDHLQNSPELLSKVKSLKGRTLGCWCKERKELFTLCHGDVLAAVAEGREWVAPHMAQGSLF